LGGSDSNNNNNNNNAGGVTPTEPNTTETPDADNDQASQGGDAPHPADKFTDIRGHWAESAIRAAVEKGLFNGVSETRFDANGTLSRAMIVTVLWRLAGRPAPNGAASFDDLPAGQWYGDAVAWAAENGIVRGYENGSFGTGDDVTREQIVTILYRFAGFSEMDVSGRVDLGAFSDAGAVPAWAAEAMSWAVNADLIRGRGDNALSPTDNATRAELATIIVRFLDLAGAPQI
jgi:hypothetical protein